MIRCIERFARLGFIDTTAGQEMYIVKQFTKYDDKGYITDVINFMYDSNNGLDVFTNSLKYNSGSRLDGDLLYAIQAMFYEIEDYMNWKEKGEIK